jgi:hypothetical protein
VTEPLVPPPASLLSGDEPIAGAGATLRDSWARSLSNLRANTVRPMLAEFLVAPGSGRPPGHLTALDRGPDGVRSWHVCASGCAGDAHRLHD